jgi:hypothetical protein
MPNAQKSGSNLTTNPNKPISLIMPLLLEIITPEGKAFRQTPLPSPSPRQLRADHFAGHQPSLGKQPGELSYLGEDGARIFMPSTPVFPTGGDKLSFFGRGATDTINRFGRY